MATLKCMCSLNGPAIGIEILRGTLAVGQKLRLGDDGCTIGTVGRIEYCHHAESSVVAPAWVVITVDDKATPVAAGDVLYSSA
jgi:translation initiation factor IF-2